MVREHKTYNANSIVGQEGKQLMKNDYFQGDKLHRGSDNGEAKFL